MQAQMSQMQTIGASQSCGGLAARCHSRLHSAHSQVVSSRDRCSLVQQAVLRNADVCVSVSARRSLATQVCR